MAEDNEKLFREESLEKISSPEALDKYVKTTTPAIILLFVAIALFLIGIFTWAFVGEIESKSSVGFIYDAETKITQSYIKESDYSNFISSVISDSSKGIKYVQDNMYMQYGNEKIKIDSFSAVQGHSETTDDFLLAAAGISDSEMYRVVYSKTIDFTISEHQFTGKIVYSLMSPINLLFE